MSGERERLLSIIEDHHPGIAGDIDDSTWLDCSCGWDQQDSKVDWHQHLLDAVDAALSQQSEKP